MSANIITSLFTTGQTPSLLSSLCPPLGEQYSRDWYTTWPNRIPMLNELLLGVYHGLYTDNDFKTWAKYLGYNDPWGQYMLDISKQPFSLDMAYGMYCRGLIDKDMLFKTYKFYAYPIDLFDTWIKGMQTYATPSDLVRFAVREVYTKSTVDAYGLDQDFPPDFKSESLKIGMSPELAQNYWRAHWELPSVGQGFEMFHRKVIDESALKDLMKAQDIMPYWRDKLIQISYNPITRVDVRRLYRLGVINDEELKNRYESIGYSPSDAKLMTEFTKRYESGEDKGITRESAIKAYREQIISRDEFITYLKMLDYSDTVVEYWLKIVDYDESNELNKLKIDELVSLYRKGRYTYQEFEQALRSAGLPTSDIDKALLTERVSTAKSIKIPGEEIVWRWYTLGIISDEDFVTRYKRLGYNDDEISNFLTEHELTGGTHKVKYLPLETYQKWFISGFINVEVTKARLHGMGISNADISTLLEQWTQDKNKTANI